MKRVSRAEALKTSQEILENAEEERKIVKMSFNLPDSFYKKIAGIAKENNTTKAEVFLKALLLLDHVLSERKKGFSLALINKDKKILKTLELLI